MREVIFKMGYVSISEKTCKYNLNWTCKQNIFQADFICGELDVVIHSFISVSGVLWNAISYIWPVGTVMKIKLFGPPLLLQILVALAGESGIPVWVN